MTATRIINLSTRKAVKDFLDINLDIDENMIYRHQAAIQTQMETDINIT